MTGEAKYLIFKIIIRAFATACVLAGWFFLNPVLFWPGVVITIISFFL